jgi:hypothetical protein
MTKFLAKLNNPVAFIVAVVLFVAFNGYLFYVYGYQQQSQPSVDANQPKPRRLPPPKKVLRPGRRRTPEKPLGPRRVLPLRRRRRRRLRWRRRARFERG